VFAAGLAVYGFCAIGWPLIGGRDLDEYLYDYTQLLDRHPPLPWSMLFRTPVPGIVDGAALDLAGGHLAEPLLGVLFAASVVAWTVAARTFGPRAALLVALALLVYPAYGLMFHELSSEPVFAAMFALWGLFVARAAARPSAWRFAYVGLATALIALVRPGNALLIVFVLFAFAVPATWRRRALFAGAFLAAAILPLAAWAVVNGVRFGDYTLARGGNAVIPFYRAYITDKIVRPDNGPASRKLAAAVRRYLVTRNPYKGYGLTTDEVFRSGSFRIHEDFYILSDQVFGWDTNYSILRKAGIEAVRRHPGAYTSGVLETIWQQLSKSYFRILPGSQPPPATPTVRVHGHALPTPSEGQPIPPGQSLWISRPDNCIREVWTSPTEHHFVFCSGTVERRFNHVVNEVNGLFRALPTRTGNEQLGLRMNQASRWYPRLILWIAVGLVALAWRRPRGWPTLVAIALAGLFVIVFNALGLFADPRFALPVAPAFVLFAAGALLGPRGAARGSPRAPTR